MRNLYFYILILVLTGVYTETFSQVFAGFKAGPSFSSVASSTQYKKSVLPGIHAGLVSNFEINGSWSFQAELLYNQKGYNHIICDDCYDRLALSYVEVPLAFRYRAWPVSTNFIMNLGIGGYGAFLLSGKYKTDIGDGELTESLDLSRDQQRFDAGLVVDLGLERQVSKGKMLVDLRIQPGLLNTDVFIGESKSQRNFSVMLSLSYLFGL
jgi:hypothetical protein